MSFEPLGLSRPILRALADKNYAQPTPIQQKAIPLVLGGRDLLGIAQTGTGKTAAFVLPSLDRLGQGKRPAPRTCRMLVLAPTRELASQIAASAEAYAQFLPLRVTTAFGGVPIGRQARALAGGVDILAATPGRLIDLIEQGCLSLGGVEILVLDEADQMLDLGFIHALKRIVGLLPRQRQTLFFSATMPKAIRELAARFLANPAEVAVTPVASTAERVDQSVCFVGQAEKQALLTLFFQRTEIERALVFTRTKRGADKVVKLLGGNGIAASAIHGNKSQAQRDRALADFRAGTVPILVATDIAARGIDVSGVSHVINFELPNVAEQYVHRIGRTARAGATGVAIAFCADDERAYLKSIERLTRQPITVVPLPENFLAEARRVESSRVAPPPHVRHASEDRPRGHRPHQRTRPKAARPQGQRRGSGARRRAG